MPADEGDARWFLKLENTCRHRWTCALCTCCGEGVTVTCGGRRRWGETLVYPGGTRERAARFAADPTAADRALSGGSGRGSAQHGIVGRRPQVEPLSDCTTFAKTLDSFPPPPILSSGPCGPQSPVVFREDQLDNVKAMYWLTSAETPTDSYGCSHGFT